MVQEGIMPMFDDEYGCLSLGIAKEWTSMKQIAEQLFDALQAVQIGSDHHRCWCPMAIKHPQMTSHTETCKLAQKATAAAIQAGVRTLEGGTAPGPGEKDWR